MEFIKRTFRKRPKVTLVSKIFGVIMVAFAIAGEYLAVMILVDGIAGGFPTREEAVAAAAEASGLPSQLVDLYAQTILADSGELVLAPVGLGAQIQFEELKSVLAWGGDNPSFKVRLGEDEFSFYGNSATALLPKADGEAGDPEPPLGVALYVPPPRWGDDLPGSGFNIEPFLVVTVTQASPTFLHAPLPVFASFDLKYAKRSDAYHFVNYRRDARQNFREGEILIVTADEGAKLEACRKDLERSERTLGDVLGDVIGVELAFVLPTTLAAIWGFRGGLND